MVDTQAAVPSLLWFLALVHNFPAACHIRLFHPVEDRILLVLEARTHHDH
jgi:hypothetical protein